MLLNTSPVLTNIEIMTLLGFFFQVASSQQIRHLLVRKKSMSWSAQSWSSETGAVCGWSTRSQAQALFNCTCDPRARTLTTCYGRQRDPQTVGSLLAWTSVICLGLSRYLADMAQSLLCLNAKEGNEGVVYVT